MLPTIEKILFCTQLGPNAAMILQHAIAIARRFDARITVLHVRQVLTRDQEGMVEGYTGRGTLHEVTQHEELAAMDELRARVEAFVTREIAPTDRHQVVEQIVVMEGNAKDEIVRQIEEVGADLVVMGAHRYGLLDILLGTTPHRVIAHSRVPVLVVPVPERKPA